MSEADQLLLAKVWLRRLWRLLENRFPDEATAIFYDDMECDGRALVEQAFEAAEILWTRDRTYVEPSRRILHSQRVSGFTYLLRHQNGDTRVISEGELLVLAGLSAEARPD